MATKYKKISKNKIFVIFLLSLYAFYRKQIEIGGNKRKEIIMIQGASLTKERRYKRDKKRGSHEPLAVQGTGGNR